MAKQQNQPQPPSVPPPSAPAPASPADQFTDPEMEQIHRYGQALGGKPTGFDEEVEKHLQERQMPAHEAGYEKMQAARGTAGLGPPEMDVQQIKQTQALQQQAAAQDAQQAQQAQAGQSPVPAPPAPSSNVGVTEPYPAQRGEEDSGDEQPPAGSQPPPGAPGQGA